MFCKFNEWDTLLYRGSDIIIIIILLLSVILRKNHQKSVLNICSNSQQSQPSQHHHREAPERYRLERRAYKNMTTENGICNTTSTIHNGYYSKQITGKFKTALSPPCSIYSNAESSNTFLAQH
jgi:hypothetical protein